MQTAEWPLCGRSERIAGGPLPSPIGLPPWPVDISWRGESWNKDAPEAIGYRLGLIQDVPPRTLIQLISWGRVSVDTGAVLRSSVEHCGDICPRSRGRTIPG